MSAFRLTIVSILFLLVVVAFWRLQKFKSVKLVTRWILVPLFILFLILAITCNAIINNAADNKIYSDVNLIPYRETALVLGANKNTAPEFFSKRIDAAVILYKAGKI